MTSVFTTFHTITNSEVTICVCHSSYLFLMFCIHIKQPYVNLMCETYIHFVYLHIRSTYDFLRVK